MICISMHYRPHPKDDGGGGWGVGVVMFSRVCLSNFWGGGDHHLPIGGGVPISGPDGGYPHPSQLWGGGVPHPFRLGGTPILPDGVTPILPDKRVPWGTPLVKTGWGTPPPRQDWMGVSFTPLYRQTEQLRGGQYASCVHAGGLSCLLMLFYFPFVQRKIIFARPWIYFMNFFIVTIVVSNKTFPWPLRKISRGCSPVLCISM